jgi:hypothetical protein
VRLTIMHEAVCQVKKIWFHSLKSKLFKQKNFFRERTSYNVWPADTHCLQWHQHRNLTWVTEDFDCSSWPITSHWKENRSYIIPRLLESLMFFKRTIHTLTSAVNSHLFCVILVELKSNEFSRLHERANALTPWSVTFTQPHTSRHLNIIIIN